MKAHEVAEHVLAKIHEIVQSGDIENDTQMDSMSTWTPQKGAKARLEIYMSVLDAVTKWQAVEPQPRRASGSVVSARHPGM